ELIELPDALPFVLPQHVEELEQLDRVEAAGDEVVVPGTVVVIDVHAEQPAVVDGELGAVGGGFTAHDRVAEVEQDADIGQADLLDAEQGTGHRAEAHAYARFARLVFDDEFEVRIFAGKLTD